MNRVAITKGIVRLKLDQLFLWIYQWFPNPQALALVWSHPVPESLQLVRLEDQQRFLTICHKTLGKTKQGSKIDPVTDPDDWKVWVSLLLRMGFIEFSDNQDDDDKMVEEIFNRTSKRYSPYKQTVWTVHPDEDGRIKRVFLYRPNGLGAQIPPPGIRHLEKIQSLSVPCGSRLPLEDIASLKDLHNLWMYRAYSTEKYDDAPDDDRTIYEFPNLRKLSLHAPQLVTHHRLLRACVGLEELTVTFSDPTDLQGILRVLMSPLVFFSGSLRSLIIRGVICYQKPKEETLLDGDHLTTILFDVLPRFPNLERLEFVDALQLEEFRAVAQKIVEDREDHHQHDGEGKARLRVSLSLIQFNLMDSRYLRNRWLLRRGQQEPETLAAFRTFLDTFCSVQDIRFHSQYKGIYEKPENRLRDRDCKHALLLNKVGRRLLVNPNHDGTAGGHHKNLPLSVWPIVLERAFRIIEGNSEYWGSSAAPTGLYYLLREGSILFDRRGTIA